MVNPKVTQTFTPPKSFVDGAIPSDMSDAQMLSAALSAWGICMAGEMPPNFCKVMAEIGARLGVVLTPQKTLELSEKWLSEHGKGSHGDEQTITR